ncbi:response regulator transcription factor [Desulfovibrio sp. Huiquan2017]|uniref:response regulator transcription factor n=1 Tax=Desulfovibrio sp. Huiquan2017 TaxID=2816861 RepID=UPI001A92FD48|nr:response regulator transcription factor [Desulfovibrio sp. Huiquan2017]
MAPSDPSAVRTLLIDDHPAVRQGLNLLLESSGYRRGTEAGTRTEAIAALETARFDLALLDLSLEDGSGLDLLADLADHGVPALIYSMHEDPVTIDRALRCGAGGYVTKREEPDVLLEGVEALLRGERFVSARAGQSLAERTGEGTDPLLLLSDRERVIFSAVGRGASNAEIADQLGISPRTVETYLARMVRKLELENVRALRKFVMSGKR